MTKQCIKASSGILFLGFLLLIFFVIPLFSRAETTSAYNSSGIQCDIEGSAGGETRDCMGVFSGINTNLFQLWRASFDRANVTGRSSVSLYRLVICISNFSGSMSGACRTIYDTQPPENNTIVLGGDSISLPDHGFDGNFFNVRVTVKDTHSYTYGFTTEGRRATIGSFSGPGSANINTNFNINWSTDEAVDVRLWAELPDEYLPDQGVGGNGPRTFNSSLPGIASFTLCAIGPGGNGAVHFCTDGYGNPPAGTPGDVSVNIIGSAGSPGPFNFTSLTCSGGAVPGITLRWDASSNASSYDINRVPGGFRGTVYNNEPILDSWQLVSGGTYTYTITAKNSYGSMPSSPGERTITVSPANCGGPPPPPPPPGNFNLTVNVSGSGTVTSSPAGISCPGDCSQSYTNGTNVTLSQSAAGGWTFSGWSGDGDCSDGQVTMNANKSCTATFTNAALTDNAEFITQTINGQTRNKDNKASIYLQSNTQYSVTVDMRNTGTSTWSYNGPYYRLEPVVGPTNWNVTSSVDGVIKYGEAGISPGAASIYPVNSGNNPSSYRFNFNITTPATSGRYDFQMRMRKGNTGIWFDELTTSIPIYVTSCGDPVCVSKPAGNCSNVPYNVGIDWAVSPETAYDYFVDISKDSGFNWTWNKQISSAQRSTNAPAGFSCDPVNFCDPVKIPVGEPAVPVLNPGVNYYTRVFYRLGNPQHVPNDSPGVQFNVPFCTSVNVTAVTPINIGQFSTVTAVVNGGSGPVTYEFDCDYDKDGNTAGWEISNSGSIGSSTYSCGPYNNPGNYYPNVRATRNSVSTTDSTPPTVTVNLLPLAINITNLNPSSRVCSSGGTIVTAQVTSGGGGGELLDYMLDCDYDLDNNVDVNNGELLNTTATTWSPTCSNYVTPSNDYRPNVKVTRKSDLTTAYDSTALTFTLSQCQPTVSNVRINTTTQEYCTVGIHGTVEWTYQDSGGYDQAQYQVLIDDTALNPNTSFASMNPEWESGTNIQIVPSGGRGSKTINTPCNSANPNTSPQVSCQLTWNPTGLTSYKVWVRAKSSYLSGNWSDWVVMGDNNYPSHPRGGYYRNKDTSGNWVCNSGGQNTCNDTFFKTSARAFPQVNFLYLPPKPAVGTDVIFRDGTDYKVGGDAQQNWRWTFSDGSPATSNNQNPTVQFSTIGVKDIELKVKNITTKAYYNSGAYDDLTTCKIIKQVDAVIKTIPSWREVIPR